MYECYSWVEICFCLLRHTAAFSAAPSLLLIHTRAKKKLLSPELCDNFWFWCLSGGLQSIRVFVYITQGDQIVCVHLTQCIRTIPTQLMIWRWPSYNTFRVWTVLYWTRSSRTQFGVSINVWRLAGDTLNITCNYLYCNHQVHRDFLITQYANVRKVSSWGSIFFLEY